MTIARLMQMARAGVPSGPVWTDPDLANASYDSVSFSVAGQGSGCRSVSFASNGDYMYVVSDGDNEVNQYTLSTPWDITTATFTQNFSVGGQDTNPSGFYIRDDGSSFFIVGFQSDDVNEYGMSTAFDLSSASFVRSFSVASQEATPTGLYFSASGLLMYVIGTTGDDVNEYGLSTAWDISTAFFTHGFSVASQDASLLDLLFNPDGTRMYIVGNENDKVYQYNLSSGGDVSTASFSLDFSVAGQATAPTGATFKSDGSKMYVLDFGGTIYQYSTD